jgi:phosphate uptake regulator
MLNKVEGERGSLIASSRPIISIASVIPPVMTKPPSDGVCLLVVVGAIERIQTHLCAICRAILTETSFQVKVNMLNKVQNGTRLIISVAKSVGS